MSIAPPLTQETLIYNKLISQSSHLLNIQNYVEKLNERGHLTTIYQDLERAFEIEKETNKIEWVLNWNKNSWKDYFHAFKLNFEAIWNMMVNDIFNNMMYQEQLSLNKLTLQQMAQTPKESRNQTPFKSFQEEQEGVSFYKRPSSRVNASHEVLQTSSPSIFEKRKYSNKENVVNQLKHKHNFRPASSNSKKKQHKFAQETETEVEYPRKEKKIRKEKDKIKMKDRERQREFEESPKYSWSRRSNSRSISPSSSFSYRPPKKFKKINRFPEEKDTSPGPGHYNPDDSFISPGGPYPRYKGLFHNKNKADFYKVHRKFK